MFICMTKIHFIICFFLEHYILKNPAIWLADSILAYNSRTNQIIARCEIGGEILY